MNSTEWRSAEELTNVLGEGGEGFCRRGDFSVECAASIHEIHEVHDSHCIRDS